MEVIMVHFVAYELKFKAKNNGRPRNGHICKYSTHQQIRCNRNGNIYDCLQRKPFWLFHYFDPH